MKFPWKTIVIFFIFVTLNVFYYRNVPGDDLSSSYIACRLLVEGREEHLYSFNSEYFHLIDDPVWIETARKASFSGFLHPYVQTPMWAYVLRPICKATNFQKFNLLFLVINFVSIAISVWLVARHWAPIFLVRPVLLVLALGFFSSTTPAYYMAYLNQTHPLFLLATIFAVVLASRERHMWAGLLLAIAASVKITPAWIAFYWLISGQRRSTISFIIWSSILGLLTFLVIGEDPSIAYLSTLNRISNVLLVSYNNQSLAAWLFGHSYGLSEIFNWRIFPLPTIAKILGYMFLGLIILDIAKKYRQKENNANLVEAFSVSSLLIASTIFTPLAWTHYYIILVVPLLILVNHGFVTKRPWFMIVAFSIVLLNVWPIAVNPVTPQLNSLSVIRSHFYSGLICLFALLISSRPANETTQDFSQTDNI